MKHNPTNCCLWLTVGVFAVITFLPFTNSVRANDEIPGAPQTQPIALVHATVHPVTSPAIEDATVVFDRGRIIAVGRDVPIPSDAKVVDAHDKHIYPGLIGGPTDLGLTEIGAVRATRDESEIGELNPNVQAEKAVNPDSEHIPTTRSNGVLFSITAPQGGLIAGSAAVLQLDGWSYEDMTLKAPAAMVINWPRSFDPSRLRRGGRSPGGERSNPSEQQERKLEDFFNEVTAYQRAREADKQTLIDARLEAMLPVINGEIPVIAVADDAGQIEAAVAFAVAHKLKLIIYGGYDAADCAPLLKAHNVPVIVSSIYRTPRRRDDPVYASYTLPARLHAAGVQFSIAGTGRFDSFMLRNLAYHAATAAAHGLNREEALRAVTLYPARIIGAADRIGSLDVGKDASLIVTDGDPLEIKTHVLAAYIQGREVDLNNRHKQLWHKYEEKYKRQETQGDLVSPNPTTPKPENNNQSTPTSTSTSTSATN